MSDEESDLLKAEREEEKRRGLLEDVMKEMHLFDLRQDEEDIPVIHQTEEDVSSETHVLHPPGITLFEGNPNSLYNDGVEQSKLKTWLKLGKREIIKPYEISYTEKVIKPESLSELFEGATDLLLLFEVFEWRARYNILADSSMKKCYMKYFFKMLFTEQTEGLLHITSSILLELINKNSKPNLLLTLFLDELPSGIINLGGRRKAIYTEEETSPIKQDPSESYEEFSPLPNLKYVLQVLKSTIVKGKKTLKDKPLILEPEIDNLFYRMMVVSHDPVILNSTLVSVFQDFFATVLELYPSDETFPEKVQDLVEKIAIYWEDSPQGFNHHTAYYVTCNVLPASRRGQHLKGSLAYYALMCCLTPLDEEVEVVNFVTLSKLLEFCEQHVDTIKSLDFYTLYSVVKLIDAAIERPFDKNTNKEQLINLKEILITNVSLSRSHDVTDIYNTTRLNIFFREVKSEWERMLNNRKPEMKQLTIPTFLTPKNSQDSFSSP